jgi:hypothetical protein
MKTSQTTRGLSIAVLMLSALFWGSAVSAADNYYFCTAKISTSRGASHPWAIFVTSKVFKASEGNVIEYTGAFSQWVHDNYSGYFHLPPGSTDQPKVDDMPGCTGSVDEKAMQHNSNLFYSQIHRPDDTRSELVEWRPGQVGLQ